MKLTKLNIKDLEAYYNMSEKILEMLGKQIRANHNSNGFMNSGAVLPSKEEQKYKEIFAKKTILMEEITKRLMDIEK